AEGTGGADLQRKLDLLNGALDAERAEQARRQMQYIAHSGYSEDSDYTSDLNFPVGQHANCSASQFRSAAHQMHTPQRSLEVSRENSYEREEYHIHGDTDPLYYNSQPRTNRIDTWSQLHAQASVESAISWRTAADWQSQEDQRRPSLERQNTLYDDGFSYGYDAYTTGTTHIRDHTQLSQQPSYEEYYDSSSYPYQTSYVGTERQWSGSRYFCEDSGFTPTEYENVLNKRRSSVVQLPQIPSKQLPPSSRYSDYNEMAPYRPRPRRTAASLPATPSSTPKRGRALPVPPGSETGSLRSGRGRRLPRLPTAAHTHKHSLPPTPAHVPYSDTVKKLPDTSYSYGYQTEDQYSANVDPYQYEVGNYSTSYDEDGMQPFFDETPHATPPAAAHKTSVIDIDSSQQNYFMRTSDEDTVVEKYVPSSNVTHLYQQQVTIQQEPYNETYKQYDEQYDNQQQYQYDIQDQQFQQPEVVYQQDAYQNKQDHQHQQQLDTQYHITDQNQLQFHQQIQEKQQYQQQDYQLEHQTFQQQDHNYRSQQVKQQQQKQPAQQLQASVLTGAATLGSLMAGGAKKLGTLFGAAAAAVAPTVSQPTASISMTASSIQYTSTAAAVTPFTSTTALPATASVPEVSPAVPVSIVTTSAPIALPRTPSLRRQESIQRPSVRRTRTLPEAPDDLLPSSYDESAYEEEYHKTEYDQTIDRDRTSLDRYHEDDYIHDTIHEDITEDRRMSGEPSGLQKTASPTRNGSQIRKPSVDSYHSQAPSIIDRRISQSSFHHEEKLTVPTSQDDSMDKSKVTFQNERSTYHEMPEEKNGFHESEHYDEHVDDYQDEREAYHDQHDTFHEDDDKFEDQEHFNETDENYQEDTVFNGGQRAEADRIEFQPEQPKLTPKQLWHRAYNKVVMQLNYADSLRSVNTSQSVQMLKDWNRVLSMALESVAQATETCEDAIAASCG
ncbi:hypothetical protein ACJJTC_017975, partial [Scirpophaga incertulas]